MLIHSHLPYDQSTSHARVPAGGIHLIASIDSISEAQVTASFFGSTKALHGEVATTTAETSTHNHSNQQYSITAVTTSAGAIAERYAYSTYGEPTICDSSGSVISNSSINNRYSYTGREWDATVGLHHFRARWMSPKTGRFLGRDPIATVQNLPREGGLGYLRKPSTIDFDVLMQALNLFQYLGSGPFSRVDPSGLLFGFSYGHFCGLDERGQGGPPIDFLDRACRRHDRCQATWWSCNPYHIFKCSLELCLDADDAVTRGCASDSSDPAKCIEAAKQIKRLFCAIAGLPWQDPHNPPVMGGPKF